MNLINWTPFRDMEGFFDRYHRLAGGSELARAGDGFPGKEFDWRPSVDISETDKEYLIKAHLPEVEKDDIELSVENGILTLSGERKYQKEEDSETQHRVESMYGHFARSFTLPSDVDASRIKAKTSKGTLKVHLPKTEVTKPKAVQIDVD
ncbi:MAG: Hsp20/alpha crystallin family protein [Gammaproteobacteria bacterium]|nr:Hsp20/alpha crystallin family protein [Gammaproteobacteria bacterium]